MTSPTERQKKAYLKELNQQVDLIDAELRKNRSQLKKLEVLRSADSSRVAESLLNIEGDAARIALAYGLGQVEVVGLDSLENSELNNLRKLLSSWLTIEVRREREKQQSSRAEKKSLELRRRELLTFRAKTGILRIRSRREFLEELKQVELELSSIPEPTNELSNELTVFRRKLNEAGDQIKELAALDRRISKTRKTITALSVQRAGTKEKMVGDRFLSECAKQLRLKNQRKSEQLRDRSERREAEKRTIRNRIRTLEKLCAENPREEVSHRLSRDKELIRNARSQVLFRERECLRLVRQLKTRGILVNLPDSRTKSDIIAWILKKNWARLPKLDDAISRLKDAKQQLRKLETEAERTKDLSRRIAASGKEIENLHTRLLDLGGVERKRNPPSTQVDSWEDAELLALLYLKWLGFSDARRTHEGADGGVDVEGKKFVAQVKYLGTGATRPMIQQIAGVAAADKKTPIFFARTYAKTASDWGQRAGVSLFRFDARGKVQPVNERARRLCEGV